VGMILGVNGGDEVHGRRRSAPQGRGPLLPIPTWRRRGLLAVILGAPTRRSGAGDYSRSVSPGVPTKTLSVERRDAPM
jgi:hypothetical protein